MKTKKKIKMGSTIKNPKWIQDIINNPKIKYFYCLVIPFVDKEDWKDAVGPLKETRAEIQPSADSKDWWMDGLLIEKNQYLDLVKKSESLEILNELEGEYEDEED